MVKCIYFSRPSSPLEESLVSVKTDKEVHEVIRLSSRGQYLNLYVVHDRGDDNVKDRGDNDNMAKDNYAYYGSEEDNKERNQLRKKVSKLCKHWVEMEEFEVEKKREKQQSVC